MIGGYKSVATWIVTACFVAATGQSGDMRPIELKAKIIGVQPMTGIVLWDSNPATTTAPIQLEFAYLTFDQIVSEEGAYDWSPLEKLLSSVAGRQHQAIVRWNDTYVGRQTGVPGYIKSLEDYRETNALSEKKPTGFPDWSHPELQRFVLEFFHRFAERYDRDPRIAFVQVGFGLWSEYHIYDGPMQLGATFPDKAFQATFARHLANHFQETHWMISVDAAGDHAPFATDETLRGLPFGLFDDSFNHRLHERENQPNWKVFGIDRWTTAPAGGEFSFFEAKDQKKALSANGPHGIPFESQAKKYHVSFIIGDDQPRFQSPQRIRDAGMSCGYRFRISGFECNAKQSIVTIANTGIAPLYYDAFPAVNGVRSLETLKGLLPDQSRRFEIPSGGEAPILTIESDRLVNGQRIEFDADL